MLPVISHSEVETLSKCERQHWYAFGMRLMKIERGVALTRGIIAHAGMETYFNAIKLGRTHDEAMDLCAKAITAEMIKDPNLMLSGAEAQVLIQGFLIKARVEISTWQIKDVEKEYRLDFPDFTYAARIDLTAIRSGGILEVFDTKTTYNYYEPWLVRLLPQVPRYVGMLRANGIWAAKGNYLFIRTRNIGEGDYRIEPIDPLSDKRIQNSMWDLIKTAKRILELRAMPKDQWRNSVTRTVDSRICQYCDFKKLCTRDLEDESIDYLVATEYKDNEYAKSYNP